MQYEPHEYCLAFPEMPASKFRELVESIRGEGLLHEITLYEGKILDGRHRYNACLELGIEPRFDQYLGDDPIGRVKAENIARRDLSPSQLSIVGARLAKVEGERARKRSEANLKRGTISPTDPYGSLGKDGGPTAEIIGTKLGIGKNTVQRGIKVMKQGTPELVKAVESDSITVTEAARIADLKPHSQRRIVVIKDKRERQKEFGKTAQQRRSKQALHKNNKMQGDAYVPGTPYVKRFLGRAEQMLNDLVAECKSEVPEDLARRFCLEMDWHSEPLKLQYHHCEKLFATLAIVQTRVAESRAA